LGINTLEMNHFTQKMMMYNNAHWTFFGGSLLAVLNSSNFFWNVHDKFL
jgi:hypothetical protein